MNMRCRKLEEQLFPYHHLIDWFSFVTFFFFKSYVLTAFQMLLLLLRHWTFSPVIPVFVCLIFEACIIEATFISSSWGGTAELRGPVTHPAPTSVCQTIYHFFNNGPMMGERESITENLLVRAAEQDASKVSLPLPRLPCSLSLSPALFLTHWSVHTFMCVFVLLLGLPVMHQISTTTLQTSTSCTIRADERSLVWMFEMCQRK